MEKIFYDAVTTVLRNRVKEDGKVRNIDFYTVGISQRKSISVTLETNEITRFRCNCRHHSIKDIYAVGLCSAVLAVLLYKMLKIHKRLINEVKPI